MKRLFCYCAMFMAILLVSPASAKFTSKEVRDLKKDLRATDLEFVRLLKQSIQYRIYLLGGSNENGSQIQNPWRNGDIRSFPKSVDRTDQHQLRTLLRPSHLMDAPKLVFDETRLLFEQYRFLEDNAIPLESTDLREYIRVTQKLPLSTTYYRLSDRLESFSRAQELREFKEVVETEEKEIKRGGTQNWVVAREDFFIAEYGPIEDLNKNFGFKRVVESRDLAAMELTYGGFKIAIDNNPDSEYLAHARFRLGDLLIEEAYILLDQGDEVAATKKVNEAMEIYNRTALALYPDHPKAEFVWFWIGCVAYDESRLLDAKDAFESLIEYFPNNSGRLELTDNAIFMLSICQADLGEITEARSSLNKLLAEGSNTFRRMAQIRLAHLALPISLFTAKFDMDKLTPEKGKISEELIEKFELYQIPISQSTFIVNYIPLPVDPSLEQGDIPLKGGKLIISDPISGQIYSIAGKEVFVDEKIQGKIEVYAPIRIDYPTLDKSQYHAEYVKLKRDVHPQHLEALVVLAEIQRETSEVDGAIETYQEAIELYKEFYENPPQGSEAQTHFMAPQSARLWYHKALLDLGEVYFQQDNLELCIKNLNILLRTFPSPIQKILRRANILLGDAHHKRAQSNDEGRISRIVDYEQVVRFYETIKREYPPLEIDRNNRLAYAYNHLSMPTKAIDLLETQVALLESSSDLTDAQKSELSLNYRMLGAIYRSIKNYEKSLLFYDKIKDEETRQTIDLIIAQIKEIQKIEK